MLWTLFIDRIIFNERETGMEVKIFVQWCVNQYLDLIQIFKNSIYEKDSNFQPGLVERNRLAKLIYLTALLNEYEEIIGNSGNALEQIRNILDSFYETVQGRWNGKIEKHTNLWKYQVEKEFEYDCFFLQLFILELFLRRLGDINNIDWIEKYLINVPLQYEANYDEENDYIISLSDVDDGLNRLSRLMEENTYIFEPSDKNIYRVDYLKIYFFYEKYFFMNKYKVKKGELCLISGSKDVSDFV